jgi:hypothetical protein
MPHLNLWHQDEGEWHLVRRLPDEAPGHKTQAVGAITPQPLFISEEKGEEAS